jgi:hypothetical protein
MKLVALVMFSLARIAVAQPSAPDPAASPGFVTLDRGDATSRAGGEASYIVPKNNGGSGTIWHLDLHGQYVDPDSGVGGYAVVPAAFAEGNGDTLTTVGDVELGGLYVARLAPAAAVIVRAGVALPSGTNDNNELLNLLTMESARLTDTYDALPAATSLRVSASPVVRQGNLFARADLGLDVNLHAPGSTDSFLRLNAGVGVDLGGGAVMAELSTVRPMGTDQTWIESAALSTRFSAGAVQPYAAVVIPIAEELRRATTAAVTVGLEATLR